MTTETRNAITAALVKGLASGMPVEQAIDNVLGAGTYKRLASEVYDALRTR
jgi:hypothetical protein